LSVSHLLLSSDKITFVKCHLKFSDMSSSRLQIQCYPVTFTSVTVIVVCL